MKTLKTIAVSVAAGIAVAAAGYAAGRFFAPRKVIAAPSVETVRTVTAASDAETKLALAKALSELEALRAEKAVLEGRLADLQAAAQTPQAEPPRRQTRAERMEELKRTDPKRYEEMQARRQEFRQRMADALNQRDDFLGAIDLSLLTPEQQETHRRFTEAVAQQRALMEQMEAAAESGQPPSEETRELIRSTFDTVRELQTAERDALLDAVALSMGLQTEEEAAIFRETVNAVYDSTGMMPSVRMGPPPPPEGR